MAENVIMPSGVEFEPSSAILFVRDQKGANLDEYVDKLEDRR